MASADVRSHAPTSGAPARSLASPHASLDRQEDPQVLRYGLGEEYQAHYDDLEEDSPRVATVLVYLSDVEAGGETVFPMGVPLSGEGLLRVVPKKGDALLFWSMDGRMREDRYSLHAGAPVERGVKWTMTVWIHSGPFREESLAYRDD
jgi:prolyl 4-hydroxylase